MGYLSDGTDKMKRRISIGLALVMIAGAILFAPISGVYAKNNTDTELTAAQMAEVNRIIEKKSDKDTSSKKDISKKDKSKSGGHIIELTKDQMKEVNRIARGDDDKNATSNNQIKKVNKPVKQKITRLNKTRNAKKAKHIAKSQTRTATGLAVTKEVASDLYNKLGIPKGISFSARTRLFQKAVFANSRKDKELRNILTDRKPVDGILGKNTKKAVNIVASKTKILGDISQSIQGNNNKKSIDREIIRESKRYLKKRYKGYRENVKKGSKKMSFIDFVKEIQTKMRNEYYQGTYIVTDGKIGHDTGYAIHDLREIGERRAKAGELMLRRVIRILQKNTWDATKVKEYQETLINLGYRVNPSGVMDTDTIRATTRFQLLHNTSVVGETKNGKKIWVEHPEKLLYVDGVPGSKTLKVMKEDAAELNKLLVKDRDKKVVGFNESDPTSVGNEKVSRLVALTQWGLGVFGLDNKDTKIIPNTIMSKHEEKVLRNDKFDTGGFDAGYIIEESRRVFSGIKNSSYQTVKDAQKKYRERKKKRERGTK